MYTIRNKTTGQMLETTPMTTEQIEMWWTQNDNANTYFGYGHSDDGTVVEVVEIASFA